MEIANIKHREAVEAEKALTKRIEDLQRTIDYHIKQLNALQNEHSVLISLRNAVNQAEIVE